MSLDEARRIAAKFAKLPELLSSFRRLCPFPFACAPIVVSDTTPYHFVSPFVACHNKGDEIAAAKAKCPECHHNDVL